MPQAFIKFIVIRNRYRFKNYLIFILFIFIFLEAKADDIKLVEIKNPIFTTKGIDGNPYEIKAETGFQNNSRLDLYIIEAKFKTSDNVWVYLEADKGSFYQSSGEIKLEKNIIVYTEDKKQIFADLAKVNTNDKTIFLFNNVKFQNTNIQITANKSIIEDNLKKITYIGNVKSKIIKKKQDE